MTLTVVDMHTGGEPLRIVTGGYPDIGGRAYYSGRAGFVVEADDELGRGFLLR